MVASPEVSPKRRVAARALDAVEAGMRLGLGTGSTATEFVELLGARVKDGLDVVCVPTSERTRRQAEGLGIRLSTLDETPELDLTVDGADEFDPLLRLIKGGGGALLREKIVAAASSRMLVIADASKRVPQLGRFPLSGRSERLRPCFDSQEGRARRRSDGRCRRHRPQAGCIGRPFRHRRRSPDLGLSFRRHPRPGSARNAPVRGARGRRTRTCFSGSPPPS